MEDRTPSGPPTPDPLPMPNNPWPQLKEYATRSKDPLKFEQDAALTLAKATAEAITQVRTMRWAARAVMDKAPLSNLPSGEALAKKLSGRGELMYQIIDAHLAILQDMMDTFIAAGKHYDAGEQENEALFDKIEARFVEPDYPTGATKVPKVDWSNDVKDGAKLDAGDVSRRLRESNDFLPSAVWGESKGQPWNPLYRLGEYMKKNYVAEVAADAARLWEWMGDRIQPIFNELVNRVDTVTADQWTGPGAAVAAAAVKQYADGIKPLRESIYLVRDNWQYTSRWLSGTAESMPLVENNPADSDPKQIDYLPLYQGLFGNFYVKGVERSASRIPTLVSPDASFKSLPPLKPNETGGKDEKGSGAKSTPKTNPSQTNYPTGGGPALSVPGGGGPGLGSGADPYSGAEPVVPTSTAGYSEQDQVAAQRASDAIARQQQADLAEYQKQQQQFAREQQQQQAADIAAQQGQQAMNQAMQQAMQAGNQAAQAAQQGLAAQQLAGLPKMPGMPGTELDPKTGQPKLGGGAGPGSGLAGAPQSKDLAQSSKLFPRAGTPVTTAGMSPATFRAGMAPIAAGSPGAPGAAGAAGRGANDGGDQHKRPTFLASTDHLEEALGEAPRVVRPVVEK